MPKAAPRQDVTSIEQLATKRDAIGASCTIAVSFSGFTPNAEAVANRHGIQLRRLSEVSVSEINALMRLDFVLFNDKRATPTCVALRFFGEEPWTLPNPEQVDMELPSTTDLFAPIFRNTDSGYTWSVNDIWQQVQQVSNPFADVQKGQPPVIRTACFPYPGNVSVETPDGPKRLGDVILSMALWIEIEQVTLDAARKVEYGTPLGEAFQRVEFASARTQAKDLRLSLQMPKGSVNLKDLRTGVNDPKSAMDASRDDVQDAQERIGRR